MATRVVTAHLDIKLARQLDTPAADLDRPKGWVVKEAVLEALAELDAGEVVPHAEIEAWAAALSRPRPAKVTKSKR